ncbi:MAG TPA: TIGR03557 family F420-dependent LLM class oxidoreductase [Candidatus Limnocylindrales bacterium]|nr:TIGR03557 family F420-dependent LLM class oxidoreductase [Candidatus Limnocylindrales bacterium]
MTEIGLALSSEEHTPPDLVRYAAMAEEAGFTFALISDHFHPWTDRQGHSAFVWDVIGAISQRTERLVLGTGVTCPTMRIHPAIIAQAAATAATLMPGRFFLGVGSGENLNEHIFGDRWPPSDVRQEMLEEAVEVMRLLWQGGMQSHDGTHYLVENACIYDLPETPVSVMVAASGPKAAKLAGRIGDGLISTAPEKELVDSFRAAGGKAKMPRYGQFTVCWAKSVKSAVATALEWWPTAAVPGELSQELPLPAHFEQASSNVTEDQIKEAIVCGPDAQPILDKVAEFEAAGFSHVYIHQVGPDQAGFMRFAERELLPELTGATRRGGRRDTAAA